MQSIDGLLQGSQKACLAAFKGKLKLLSTKKKKNPTTEVQGEC